MQRARSAREIELELKKKLGTKYLQNPQISVLVKEHYSQRVTIEGAVKSRAAFKSRAESRFCRHWRRRKVLTTSPPKGAAFPEGGWQARGRQNLMFQIYAMEVAEDPQLEAGDVIIVSTSDLKEGMNLFLKLASVCHLAPYL